MTPRMVRPLATEDLLAAILACPWPPRASRPIEVSVRTVTVVSDGVRKDVLAVRLDSPSRYSTAGGNTLPEAAFEAVEGWAEQWARAAKPAILADLRRRLLS